MRHYNLLATVVFACCSTLAACHAESPTRRITTPENVALQGLNAQIDGRYAAWERSLLHTHASTLADLLLVRSHHTGRFSDLGLLYDIATRTLAAHPNQPDSYLLLATAEAALHNFSRASAALAQAAILGKDTALAEASISLAVGNDPSEVVEGFTTVATQTPVYTSLTAAAVALGAHGEFEAADAMFDAAAQSYRDLSPFPLAWAEFHRGLMWAEQADDGERARVHYEAALHYLPSYVVANVHLAELEYKAGQKGKAKRRLESLVGTTEDPEPLSRLAQFVGDSKQAAEFSAQADARYTELLHRHRAAFADHASEFYAGAGSNASKALELALDNLANRQTERAYIIAMGAAKAAGDLEQRCILHAEALSRTTYTVNLARALEDAAPACP